MIEITPEIIQKSLDNATDEQIDFVLDIDQKNSVSTLAETANNFDLRPDEIRIVNENIKYLVLRIRSLSDTMDTILDACASGEQALYTYIQYLFFDMDMNLKNLIKNRVENKGIEADFPGIFDPEGSVVVAKTLPSDNRSLGKSADILIKEIGIHNSGDQAHLDDHGAGDHSTNSSSTYSFTPSKKDLLSEIESPTDTTKKPYFELPKTKPAAADVLKGLVNAPYTMSDTVKITEGDQTITIIDPFKKMHADQKAQENAQKIALNNANSGSTTSSIGATAPASTPTPSIATESTLISSNNPFLAPEINSTPINKAGSDSKFSSVSKNTQKEVFSTPGHDPYREAPLS